MTKILDEVRQISSDAIAKKQDKAKANLPKIFEQIKKAAALGKTECEFREFEIDEHGQRLLKADGFHVYTTTKKPDMTDYRQLHPDRKPVTVWVVSW